MRKILIIVVLLFLICGCKSASEQYLDANYANAETALPDLIRYIENDPELDESDKELRIKSIEEWHLLIKETHERLHSDEVEK